MLAATVKKLLKKRNDNAPVRNVDLGGWAESLFVSDSFAGRGIFKPEKALELLRLHQSGTYELGHRLWSLIVLEIWFREWID